jgi:hypothetical protein
MGGAEHSLGVLGGERSAEEDEQDGQNGCGQEREEREGQESRLYNVVSVREQPIIQEAALIPSI